MYKKIIIGLFLFGGFWSFVSATSWNLPGVNVITRVQWGANESWRYSSTSKTERDALRQQETDAEQLSETAYQGQMATDYLLEKTPTEQTVDEYREISSGNFLKWPESIHKNKSKIIIHHTADDNSSLFTGWTWAAIEEMQAIYKYHTLIKWWWDIGYNFIIDPFGNIYEGRAGWAWVVWAHVAWNNTPSVGISMMWNFNIQVPTDAALKSLTNLTTALAKKYKINPQATTTYFKKSNDVPYLKEYTNYTIAGHEDAWVTACPWTNLYDLLPELRDQVSKNLSTITLVGARVPVTIIPKVIDRWTTVAGLYYSDKTTDTFVLPIRWSGVSSCTTTDSTISINSCSSQNNKLIISLTRKGISWIKTISAVTSSWIQTFSINLIWQDDFAYISNTLKQDYMTRKWISSSSQGINKITSKITLSDITTLIQTPLNVLLYELSTSYPRQQISCDGGCRIQADDKEYTWTNPVVEISNWFIYLVLPDFENSLAVNMLEISSINWWLVHVDNYIRKSYGGTPWNTFRGSLIWKKETIKNLAAGKFMEQSIVINKTTFDNYMQGIAETSDADSIQKQTLVLLLAKMYTLFYLNGENIHPSIPAGASYQAIDNPDMFQKYVWAWREKTSKMSAILLSKIKNMAIMYDDYVPILPYFSCSAGFTWSAQEKWWWIDTPYLQSKLDFNACFDFSGHGVGLSGKWAQYLASKWRTLQQILQYYYPGVELINY